MVRIEVTIPRPSSFMWAKHLFPDKWSSMGAWTTFCLSTFLFIQDEHFGLVMICCLLLLITVSQDPLCHWRVISAFWIVNVLSMFKNQVSPHDGSMVSPFFGAPVPIKSVVFSASPINYSNGGGIRRVDQDGWHINRGLCNIHIIAGMFFSMKPSSEFGGS